MAHPLRTKLRAAFTELAVRAHDYFHPLSDVAIKRRMARARAELDARLLVLYDEAARLER